MVKTLLRQAEQEEINFNLYIIAASFQKMDYRIKSKQISTLYLACLQEQTKFAYTKLPPKSVVPKAGDNNRDDSFIGYIPDLAKVAKTKIPNLQHAANLPQPIEIYNESTYMEFHLLLCELLSGYSTFLTKLSELQDSGKKEQLNLEAILDALWNVYTFGIYLRSMVRSSAIETHLQIIAPLLDVDPQKSWTPESEEDMEFSSLKPYSMRKGKILSPWESYRDWLRLMVHYFDAAKVLIDYAKRLGQQSPTCKPPAISITILSPPLPNNELLYWTTLLEDERFFPTMVGQPSGKDFVKFLKDLDGTSDSCQWFYDNLKKLRFSGKHHCEAYIASLLALLGHFGHSGHDFEEQLDKLSEPEIEQIKALLTELEASHVFMHHLNLC